MMLQGMMMGAWGGFKALRLWGCVVVEMCRNDMSQGRGMVCVSTVYVVGPGQPLSTCAGVHVKGFPTSYVKQFWRC